MNRSKGRPIIDTNSQEEEERSPSLQEIYTEFGPHNTGITEKQGWDHKINKQVERKAYVIRNVAKPNVCQVSAIAFPAASF